MFSQPKIPLKRALHSRVFGHSAQSFPERMMHNTLQVFVRKRDLYLWGSFARKTYYLGRLYHVVWPFTGHCPQESPISFLGSFAKEICTEPSNRCHPGWVMSHLSRIPHDPLSHTASWPIITHCDMSLHNVATPHQLLWAVEAPYNSLSESDKWDKWDKRRECLVSDKCGKTRDETRESLCSVRQCIAVCCIVLHWVLSETSVARQFAV